MITIALSITDGLICIELFMRFNPKSQQRPSVKAVKHTQLLANHSTGGRLLQSTILHA